MNPSAQILRRWAVETGWRPEALEKVVRLGSVAGDVFRHPALRDALALKGGTALNLGYGPPTRLSVDLDLNYVGRSDREAMLAERPAIEGALVALAERGGYRVQQTADAFAGRTLHLRYRSALGPPDRVEVDLNYLYRQPIEECEATLLWQPPGLDPVPVRTCSLTECQQPRSAVPRSSRSAPGLRGPQGLRLPDWPGDCAGGDASPWRSSATVSRGARSGSRRSNRGRSR